MSKKHSYLYTYSFHHLYRQQKLQFRPPIEELRAKYYRDMKKFMCIPLHFRGVGESGTPANTIFPRLIDCNASSFSTVYRKVEWSCCVIYVIHVLCTCMWRNEEKRDMNTCSTRMRMGIWDIQKSYVTSSYMYMIYICM